MDNPEYKPLNVNNLIYSDAKIHSVLITEDDVKVLMINFADNVLELLFDDVQSLNFIHTLPFVQEIKCSQHYHGFRLEIKSMTGTILDIVYRKAFYRNLGL